MDLEYYGEEFRNCTLLTTHLSTISSFHNAHHSAHCNPSQWSVVLS